MINVWFNCMINVNLVDFHEVLCIYIHSISDLYLFIHLKKYLVNNCKNKKF